MKTARPRRRLQQLQCHLWRFIAPCVLAAILSHLPAESAHALGSVDYGRYKLSVQQKTEPGGRVGWQKVSCKDENPHEIKARKYQKLSSSARTETLVRLSSEVVAEAELPAWMAELKAKFAILAQSQLNREQGIEQDLTIDFTQSKTVRPLQCFDQIVEVILENEVYEISGVRPGEGWFSSDENLSFKVSEGQPVIITKAYYNESCNPARCALDRSTGPVYGDKHGSIDAPSELDLGSSSEQQHLWTKIEDRRTQFYLPLYWGVKIDPRSLADDLRSNSEEHFVVVPESYRIPYLKYKVVQNAWVKASPSSSAEDIRELQTGTVVQVVWSVPNGAWHLVAVNGEILGFVRDDSLQRV